MEDEPIKKKGRGRPRKSTAPAPIPEEIVMLNDPVVARDLERRVHGAPVRSDADDVEEVIELAGYEAPTQTEPEAEPEAPPQPMRAPPVHDDPVIVHVSHAQTNEAADKARRHAAISRIKKYRESFAAVKAMQFNENASTEALEAHLEDIRVLVSSKNTALLVKGAYLAGVRGIEVGAAAVGMRSYGLTQILSQSAEVDGLLKEITCEMHIPHIPAHVRLMMATFQTVFVLDSANKRAEALAGFTKAAVNPELKERFKDI